MLLKLFSSRTNPLSPNPNPDANPNPSDDGVVVGEKPSILQIVHAGGVVERYYMALPASSIMEKYPTSVLARPEIFRRPWDSVVQPEEILVPGQRYFLVPDRTVKKLRRRIRNPNIEASNSPVDSSTIKSSFNVKSKPGNRRVRFKGIETKTKGDLGGKKSSSGRGSRKMIVRFAPSLSVIDESQGFDD